jgi:hypothetical protein
MKAIHHVGEKHQRMGFALAKWGHALANGVPFANGFCLQEWILDVEKHRKNASILPNMVGMRR